MKRDTHYFLPENPYFAHFSPIDGTVAEALSGMEILSA